MLMNIFIEIVENAIYTTIYSLVSKIQFIIVVSYLLHLYDNHYLMYGNKQKDQQKVQTYLFYNIIFRKCQ